MVAFKVATLNLCLGHPNKNNLVKQMIADKKTHLYSIQNTNVKINLDHGLLSFQGYKLENEKITVKAKVTVSLRKCFKNVFPLQMA
jgi:hypothetical protein